MPRLNGTAEKPIVLDEVVVANPRQTNSSLFRWGPRVGDLTFAIETVHYVTVRVRLDPAEPLVTWQEFSGRVLRVIDGVTHRETDDYLRSLLAREHLEQLRDAVLKRGVGGPNDGAPKRRRRKPVTA
jgi:hypothetical protein